MHTGDPGYLDDECGPGAEPDPSEMNDDLKETIAEIEQRKFKHHTKTSWSVGNDGKVTVRIVEGSRDLVPNSALRTHALW